MAFLDRLREAVCQSTESSQDPWEPRLSRALARIEAMSSVGLLDLLMVEPTTANARRLAVVMRRLGFVAIKNRRLLPGGNRDTVARGWARPVRGSLPLSVGQSVSPGLKLGR
jgi:hypothetical protein